MIYICVPARDEERTIGVLLWKIRKVMRDFPRDYHVLVLDDASTDGTAAALERYRRALPLTVLTEERPAGYHGALERLIREAVRRARYPKRDAVVTLQGDFTESPEYIEPLIKTLEGGADIVAGAARLDDDGGSGCPRQLRWARRAASVFMGGALRQAPVSDPLCGLRAHRVIVLKKALRAAGDAPLLTAEGWGANVQLLAVVAPHARRIEEVPVEMRFDLRARESRFRLMQTVRQLYRVRGGKIWDGLEQQA